MDNRILDRIAKALEKIAANTDRRTQLPMGDVLIYLELTRIALGDADFFDQAARDLDLSDTEMVRLRNQLAKYMEEG